MQHRLKFKPLEEIAKDQPKKGDLLLLRENYHDGFKPFGGRTTLVFFSTFDTFTDSGYFKKGASIDGIRTFSAKEGNHYITSLEDPSHILTDEERGVFAPFEYAHEFFYTILAKAQDLPLFYPLENIRTEEPQKGDVILLQRGQEIRPVFFSKLSDVVDKEGLYSTPGDRVKGVRFFSQRNGTKYECSYERPQPALSDVKKGIFVLYAPDANYVMISRKSEIPTDDEFKMHLD